MNKCRIKFIQKLGSNSIQGSGCGVGWAEKGGQTILPLITWCTAVIF